MKNKYPHGKLNEHDEGKTTIAVGIENNCILIRFEKPIAWLGLDKMSALALANSLIEKVALINEGTKQ